MNTDEQIRNEEFNEISIKEIIEIVWRNKWLIIIITLLSGILALVAGNVMTLRNERVETIISLEWSGLVEGTYPNGNRFIYNTMFESYVFSDALINAEIENVTITQLRSALVIKPILPASAIRLVEQSIERGEQITYYATEYKLTLELGTLPIDHEQATLLLEYLIMAFMTDFESKYIQKSVVLKYTDVDLDHYDYDETYQVFVNQTEVLESVIERALETGSEFTSSSLNIGFSDLLSRVILLKSIDLENINTRVNTHMLTKESDFLITRIEFLIDQQTLALDKLLAYESKLQANIIDYTGSEVVVIIPGMEGNFKIDPYINTLYDELITTQKQITVLENDIAYNSNRVDNLMQLKVSENSSAIYYQNQIDRVEIEILSASSNINDVAEDLNIMLTEYSTYLTRNNVIPLTAPQVTSDVSLLIYVAIGTVIGGMMSLFVVFLKETLKKT